MKISFNNSPKIELNPDFHDNQKCWGREKQYQIQSLEPNFNMFDFETSLTFDQFKGYNQDLWKVVTNKGF